MSARLVRTTVYLRPELHRALRVKAASVRRSMSDLINEAVLHELQEDMEDLAAFDQRDSEKTLSYRELARQMLGAGRKFAPERDAITELVEERAKDG